MSRERSKEEREERLQHQGVRCPWENLSKSILGRHSRREQSTEPELECGPVKTETGHDAGIAGMWLGQEAYFRDLNCRWSMWKRKLYRSLILRSSKCQLNRNLLILLGTLGSFGNFVLKSGKILSIFIHPDRWRLQKGSDLVREEITVAGD